ncbi:ABC1 kinase family protein [Motiliproteus sp.]|uniref:ABC1 kinase family protein n=1 Tax=Motiliproteus sp. TaxID=1898955 RepID=UPI003BAC4A2A
MAREPPLPSHRARRLMKLGRLVGGLAGGMIREGANNLLSGRPLHPRELLLTPGNARRVADRLSEMRGAAMKVGQLLSMEAGDYLPPELTQILSSLRENAHSMPLGQVALVMQNAWGRGWEEEFERFSFTPLAAASIGQVHEALTKEGQHLAIKIQYPGVRQSIDSDVDNVSTLFNLLRLVPKDFDLSPLLEEAKRQLHLEADYCVEAQQLNAYRRLLADSPEFVMPEVVAERTTQEVLCMTYLEGMPIEQLASASAEVRNLVATQLAELVLRELFEWGLVQTDSNFGNFRYQAEQERIGLLDFGATRAYSRGFIERLRRLMRAARAGDLQQIENHAGDLGYLRADEAQVYRHGLSQMINTVAEPFRHQGPYDFAASDLSQRVADIAIDLRVQQRYLHLPPTDVLFLHRKIAGTYLLCARLRAQVDVSGLVERYLESPTRLPEGSTT